MCAAYPKQNISLLMKEAETVSKTPDMYSMLTQLAMQKRVSITMNALYYYNTRINPVGISVGNGVG
jgi:hypothetical protein